MKTIRRYLFLALLLIFALACGGGETTNSQPASQEKTVVACNIDLTSLGRGKAMGQFSDVNKVVVDVKNSSGQVLIQRQVLVQYSATIWGGTISGVPVGQELQLDVLALDSEGEVLFQGSTSRTFQQGTSENISIDMESVDDASGNINHIPQIYGITYEPSVIEPGDEVTLKANVADLDGDELAYGWFATSGNGSIIEYTTDSAIWKAPDLTGQYEVEFSIVDPESVNSVIIPLRVGGYSGTGVIGVIHLPQIVVSWHSDRVEILFMSSSNIISQTWTDHEGQVLGVDNPLSLDWPSGGSFSENIHLTLLDSNEITIHREINLVGLVVPDIQISVPIAPTFESSPITDATVDHLYQYDVEVADVDGDALSITLTTAPSGMEISSQNVLTWTPETVGVFEVGLSLTDGVYQVPQVFSLRVTERVSAPFLILNLAEGSSDSSIPLIFADTLEDINVDAYKKSAIVLRRISSGNFLMGSPDEELGRSYVEAQHQVQLTKDYYLGVFELTQAQYQWVMGTNPSTLQSDGLPVTNLSWNAITATSGVLAKLSNLTGMVVTLPSEAQWEYACRAGTLTSWNNGSNSTDNYVDSGLDPLAVYNGNSSGTLAVAGSKLANAWKCFDMHGNVREWCLDYFGDYGGAEVDPTGPSSGATLRVVRGGGYLDRAALCRAAYRSGVAPTTLGTDIGVRLLIEVDD